MGCKAGRADAPCGGGGRPGRRPVPALVRPSGLGLSGGRPRRFGHDSIGVLRVAHASGRATIARAARLTARRAHLRRRHRGKERGVAREERPALQLKTRGHVASSLGPVAGAHLTDAPARLVKRGMDPAKRQQLVERMWLLEQLRAEAKARAGRASADARRAQDAADAAGRQAAELHDRAAELGGELADLHDQLGDPSRAARERAEAHAERRDAAEDRERGRPSRRGLEGAR